MALDQKALQKKRAKRELKRRQPKPVASGLPGALSAARVWANVDAAEYPTVLARIRGNPTESAEAQHPSCARKLVEEALAYLIRKNLPPGSRNEPPAGADYSQIH